MSNQKPNNNIKVFFDTLGCAKNLVDTSKMSEALSKSFFSIVDEAADADVIILNTCAFIEAAAQESIDTFFEYHNFYPDKNYVITGCLPSRYGDMLVKSLPEADMFVNCNKEKNIVDLLSDLLRPCEKQNNGLSIKQDFRVMPTRSSAAKRGLSEHGRCPEILGQKTPFSYIKISEGCNRFCSYCVIPYIRGKYRSIGYENIYQDIETEKAKGAKEIVLVAQDCGVWGTDLEDKKSLAWLLDKLSISFPEINFRILYIQPDAINNELLDLVADRKNIISYFDIPMQHCDKEILKSMNRKGDKDCFLNLISQIREKVPGAIVRSTFIVGYPGESDEQFEDLCEFCKKAEFDYAGCFEYSQEEGTKAAVMDTQIEKDIKLSRSNILREILDNISVDRLDAKIGERYQILVEGIEDGRFYGRAYFQAPDVDGVVYISEYEDKKNIKLGDFINVKIVDSEYYDLVGKVC